MIAQYRRTVSAVPALKRLVAVVGLHDEPIPFGEQLGQLCPDVLFGRLEDRHGAHWWAKRWLKARRGLLQPTWQIERFLKTLGRDDLVLAQHLSAQHGLVYAFNPGLFTSTVVVHQWDWGRHFSGAELVALRALAALPVDWPGLPALPLGVLTDLQATWVDGRVRCLDFEPSARWALGLAGVTIP